MRTQILKKIQADKLVVIARKIPSRQIPRVAEALCEGGVTLLEVTFDQGNEDCVAETSKCIAAICDKMGEKMLVGAGTVLTVGQVKAAYEAGAKYIVAPNTNLEVIQETLRLGMVAIPGAMTPTEIAMAWNAGANLIKLFPADDLGCHYIKNILAPLCHIPLLATGGVNPTTIPEFYAAGIMCFGTGITILKPELVRE
jgi:2-dehydro-3-deoxyphosphogluconate aldolase/(4S)-4-hydroxy-2-oxoglutarate aldolase